ncbi:hypothetical protein [Priestia megaterium]
MPVNDPPVGPVVVTLVTNEDTPVSSQLQRLIQMERC